MPPRSYYNDPRLEDYLTYARLFFPEQLENAVAFSELTGRPYIADVNHLSAYLGISSSLVRQIIHKRLFHYRIFPLEKADGTHRIISTPKTYLKVLQWWIADNILETADLHDAVHGFRKGRSYITNAEQHVGSNHILNLDIAQFFPSISTGMVMKVFRDFGYAGAAVDLLTALTTLVGEAPTGAPTSPAIGNLILSSFDTQVSELAEQHGIKYTRYADDLTFSSKDWIEANFKEEVQALIEASGFVLNPNKTRFMGRGDRMEVTGLVINNGVCLTREWRNWARGYVHRALLNPADYIHERNVLNGIYGTLTAVDREGQRSLTVLAKEAIDLVKLI